MGRCTDLIMATVFPLPSLVNSCYGMARRKREGGREGGREGEGGRKQH